MVVEKDEREPPKSLAVYLNVADYNGLMKNRGKGIRKWRMVENKEWTFKPDFLEKLNSKISKWVENRNLALARSASILKDKQEDGTKPQEDPPQFIWVKGLRYRYAPEGKEDEAPPPVQAKTDRIESEDAVDHQRSLTLTTDVGVGTDDSWAVGEQVRSSSSSSAVNLSHFPCNQSQSSSLLGAYVPPHLKQQQLVAPTPSSSSACRNQKQVTDISRVDQMEYEKAKSWTPKSEEQRNALDQAKLDIFNVLIVGKGCALNYLIREFFRVTEEQLDLKKIGVPDLRTLLVQMTPDMIYFRRERKYSGKIFVFPNLANSQFEMVAHIGELVAEQRKDKNFIIPDESLLCECDVTELFESEWSQQQQQQAQYTAPPFQSSYYGTYTNPNYNYEDYSNYYLRMYGGVGGSQQDYQQYLQSVSQQINNYAQQYYAKYGYPQQQQQHQGYYSYRH